MDAALGLRLGLYIVPQTARSHFGHLETSYGYLDAAVGLHLGLYTVTQATRSFKKPGEGKSCERALRPRSSPTQTVNFAQYRKSRLESICSRLTLLDYIPYHKQRAGSKSPEQEENLERALRPNRPPRKP